MTTMKVLKNNCLKCIRVIKVLDIGLLRPSTVTQVIVEVVKVVDISLKIPDTFPQVIAEVLNVGQV